MGIITQLCRDHITGRKAFHAGLFKLLSVLHR